MLQQCPVCTQKYKFHFSKLIFFSKFQFVSFNWNISEGIPALRVGKTTCPDFTIQHGSYLHTKINGQIILLFSAVVSYFLHINLDVRHRTDSSVISECLSTAVRRLQSS